MRQRGFTLLEVLVAIVVLSSGMLGLAGLMASSLRNSHSAYQHTQAAWLAYDVIDRMRVNRPGAIATDYNIPMGTASSASSGLAGSDITGWKSMLASTLPDGDGSVVVVPATGAVTVVILWNDTRGTRGISAQTFRVDTLL
jgi:type IV pilus assembly protein PilV